MIQLRMRQLQKVFDIRQRKSETPYGFPAFFCADVRQRPGQSGTLRALDCVFWYFRDCLGQKKVRIRTKKD